MFDADPEGRVLPEKPPGTWYEVVVAGSVATSTTEFPASTSCSRNRPLPAVSIHRRSIPPPRRAHKRRTTGVPARGPNGGAGQDNFAVLGGV